MKKWVDKFYDFWDRNKEELFFILVLATIIVLQFLASPNHGTNWKDEYRQMQLEENINI